jgi:hypothetical protein
VTATRPTRSRLSSKRARTATPRCSSRENTASLEQVKDALDAGVDLRLLVRRQLEAVDSEIELQRRLRERLTRVLEAPNDADADRDDRGDDDDREALHA